LPQCQYKYESDYPDLIKFACNEPTIGASKFCFFHDKDHYAEYEEKALERFEEKVRESICEKKSLECFGYYLPEINFADLLKEKYFTQPVYFNEANFYDVANFSDVRFSKTVDFSQAIFLRSTSFRDTIFSQSAYFSHATFPRGEYLEPIFSHATFSEEAYFDGATFPQGADYSKVIFFKEARFQNATFKHALFPEAEFSKEASFDNVRFNERADFSEAKFFEEADFEGATFSGLTTFFGAKFLNDVYFLKNDFTGKTFFRHTLFEKPNKVTFDDTDLSNVSFADSDITRIRFSDKIRWGGNDRLTIIEEEWLKRKAQEKNDAEDEGGVKEVIEEMSLELVLSVYRNLRELRV
jgi:uncharacterized protein YjbI with pentapeptide repeats